MRDSERPSRAREHAAELCGWIGERAADIERERSLPADVLAALTDAGCFRMAVARRHGGDDLALAEVLAVVETLARADAAVGWAVGQVALSQVMLGHLAEAALDEIYDAGPDTLAAGAAAPKGHATRTPGGWLVSGRWPLVSGCRHARWIFLQCVALEGREVRTGEGGLPRLVMAVLPASAVEIVDTWDAVGLRGTGSHDVAAARVECDDRFTCELALEPVCSPTDAAIMRVAPATQGGLFVAATVLGLARAAVDALAGVAAAGKRSAFSPVELAASPVFQTRLADADVTVRAARALLQAELQRAEARAEQAPLGAAERARLRAAAVRAIALAAPVVDAAYALAGSASLYASSPMQRRLRDAHAAVLHFTAATELYGPHGALLAGAPVSPALV